MPLESCMLVLDNSEYMRNGDYAPTRMQAQAEAVSAVFTSKTNANPESAVGVMTMAGKSPTLLATPTNDIGKLLSALSKSQIGGLADLQTSVQIAQLALKHRENKNQMQRIVVFVGSPLNDSKDALEKLGKRLRKNNVKIDVVTFGEEGMENDDKLGALVEGAGGDDSHLVSVPPGPHLLSDIIISSPILHDPENPNAGIGGEDGGMDLDPNMDPELAMAIRMSIQEAEAAARAAAPPSAPEPSTSTSTSSIPTETSAQLPSTLTAPLSNANDPKIPSVPGDSAPIEADDNDDDDEEDEEEMMRRAIALSRGESGEVEVEGEDVMMLEDDEEDEEAAIARAIAMSLQGEKKDGEK